MITSKLTRRHLMHSASMLFAGWMGSTAGLAQSTSSLSNDDIKPVYIPPNGGQKGKISRADITFKLDKTQTAGSLGGAEMILPPGQLGAPPHYHKNFDEICIVLKGSVHIMVEDDVVEVKEGGWHLRPRGKVHTFWNSGEQNANIIDLCTPGGHEQYLKDLTKLFENGSRPGPGDMQRLAKTHDIVFRYDKLEEVIKKYNVRL